MKLVLVRHGESETNAGEMVEGPEPHLTQRGRRQARHAAERARSGPYAALYSSPMSRALETACALAEATRLEPRVLVHFCEHRELPDFRGFPRSFLESRFPTIALPDECTEEGWWPGELEHEEALYERARQAASFLLDRHAGTHDRVLLVTHGGFASAFISALFGLPPCGYMRFWHDNCAFSEFYLRSGTVCLVQMNSTWHLPADEREESA